MGEAGDSNNKKKAFLNDHQLKELIKTEEVAKQRWEKKWGFFDRNFIQNIYREEAEKLGLQADYLEHRKKIMKTTPDIKLEPSPPAPKTTSQFVGWRSQPEHKLEFCGPMYVSPKAGLKKESYNNIFLG